MARHDQLCRAGAWVFILWGLGHAVFIDLLPLALDVHLFDIHDRDRVLPIMRETEVRFPVPGRTNLYLAFWGFSIWLGLSLVTLGVLNLLLLRIREVAKSTLRGIYVVDLAAAIGFLVIAAICFFSIPVLGGVLATALFSAALVSSFRVDSARC